MKEFRITVAQAIACAIWFAALGALIVVTV